MRALHLVLPNDIDDATAPSGGNIYDRRVSHGLAALGWRVLEHPVSGTWPWPAAEEVAALGAVLAGVPDEATVLVDGLVGCAAPEPLEAHARRLRLLILAHMPLAEESERLREPEARALAAAQAVVATSRWSRQRLIELYRLDAGKVHVATPGVDAARLASPSPDGGNLLCVAALAPHKGQDVLAQALAGVADLPWRCVCVGSVRRDAGFADRVRQMAAQSGIGDRMHLVGLGEESALNSYYAQADLLVSPSRVESYGMVVTEALARGIPVLAAAVGGLPEALGRARDGSVPGMLVAPEDPASFSDALRRWLVGEKLREQLRRSAYDRRATLTGWAVTTRTLAGVLSAPAPADTKIYSRSVEDFADTP